MSSQLDPGYEQRQAERIRAYDDAMAAADDPDTAHLERPAIDNCELCDDDGYRGSTICDHRDHAAAAARGRAACQAALLKFPKTETSQ